VQRSLNGGDVSVSVTSGGGSVIDSRQVAPLIDDGEAPGKGDEILSRPL